MPAITGRTDPRSDAALAPRNEHPPQLAVVECDGGRIRTREPGHGPGVHRAAEGWREDKNACLIRAQRTVSAVMISRTAVIGHQRTGRA